MRRDKPNTASQVQIIHTFFLLFFLFFYAPFLSEVNEDLRLGCDKEGGTFPFLKLFNLNQIHFLKKKKEEEKGADISLTGTNSIAIKEEAKKIERTHLILKFNLSLIFPL